MLIEQESVVQLGFELMDLKHNEFADLLNRLEQAGGQDYPALFRQLLDHAEHHFEEENRLMEQYRFPAIAEHKGEHQRVLGELKQFGKRVDRGMVKLGREFIRERLLGWFLLHLTTMDAALAAHLNRVGLLDTDRENRESIG